MAEAIKGLRLRPKYEDLIGVAVSDKLYNIKFPNRDATFLRNGFVLSQLDGEGMRQMQQQQEMAAKEAFKETLLKRIAKNTGANMHDLRSESSSQSRRERINRAVYYNMADGDEEEQASMSVQGEGLDQYQPPDEDMQSSVSSDNSRSRIVADYERRFQQLKTEHENELRLRDLQEAKKLDMIQQKAKQELEDSEYVREMEEKKTLTLAAIKEAEN